MLNQYLSLFSSLNILMEFPFLVICDHYPVHFQEEADSDSSLTTLFAAGSRALPPPWLPTKLSMLPSPLLRCHVLLSPDHTGDPALGTPHFFYASLNMVSCSNAHSNVFFVTVHDTACSNLPPINDSNSSLHLLSPATFPAMCC